MCDGGDIMTYLIAFRKNKGLTRTEMAKKLGISHSYYEKIELGDREPSRNILERVKRTFPSFDMNIFFDEKLHEMCNKGN